MNAHQKRFIGLIDNLVSMSGVRARTIFRDFVALAALEMSASIDLRTRNERLAELASLRSRYTPEQLNKMAEMLSCVVESLQAGMHDCLGELYMQLGVANEARGQFFTPFEVGLLAAHVNLADCDEIISRKGYVTMDEPASGAGCMAIAFASVLAQRGHNYQRTLHARLTDVDPTAVHMSYVQLSLLYIPAQIVLGNSLWPNKADVHWFTPAHILDGWGHKLARDRASDSITA